MIADELGERPPWAPSSGTAQSAARIDDVLVTLRPEARAPDGTVHIQLIRNTFRGEERFVGGRAEPQSVAACRELGVVDAPFAHLGVVRQMVRPASPSPHALVVEHHFILNPAV